MPAHSYLIKPFGATFALVSLVFLPAFAQVSKTIVANPRATMMNKATRAVRSLAQGEYLSAATYFDPNLRKFLTEEKIRHAWNSLLTNYGEFTKILEIEKHRRQQYQIIYVTCEFARAHIDAKFVFNPEGQITGLWFVPAGNHAPVLSNSYPESYDLSGKVTAIECEFGNEQWILPGILTIPTDSPRVACVLLVAGIGPHDRNFTLGPNQMFRDLADGLTALGIGAFRYDNREFVYGNKANSRDSLDAAILEDVEAAVKYLQQRPEIDPDHLFVLGYDLAGMLVPRVLQMDPSLAGGIILAGPSRRYEERYLAQMNYLFQLDGALSQEETQSLAQLQRQIQRVRNPDLPPETDPQELPLNMSGRFWSELREYDPLTTAQTLTKPLLILQAGRDYEVTLEDYQGWNKALANQTQVEFKLYLPLNHHFMAGDETRPSEPGEYRQPGQVAEVVIQDIVHWVAAQQPNVPNRKTP